jgi:hypothetical protein
MEGHLPEVLALPKILIHHAMHIRMHWDMLYEPPPPSLAQYTYIVLLHRL